MEGQERSTGNGNEVDYDPAGVIVLVGGFLAPRGDAQTRGYWGEALEKVVVPPGWRVVVAHPSPVASLHDRACQLFYQLKGGPTYYGLAHAAEHGHAAVDPCGASSSNERVGLHPKWSAAQPVHFIAHSLGGNTVRFLLQLMREGHECLRYSESRPGDLNTSADASASYPTSAWVRSITCLCTPINGGPVVYGLGGDPHGSATVRWGSGGFCLSAAIALVEGSKAVGLPWRQARRKSLPTSSSSCSSCSECYSYRDSRTAVKMCQCILASPPAPPAPPAMDFGLAHFFQRNRRPDDCSNISPDPAGAEAFAETATWDQHYDWLLRAVRFLWGLLQFALPWPLGASASGKGQLAHGFAVFSNPDNLAYDVQVGAANAVNQRIAATAMATEAVGVMNASTASLDSHNRSSTGSCGNTVSADEALPALTEDPHTYLFSVVGTQRQSAACGLGCPCQAKRAQNTWYLKSFGAALMSFAGCLAACLGALVKALVSEVRKPQHSSDHQGNKSMITRALEAAQLLMWGFAAGAAADMAGWLEERWDAVNVQSVAAVGWVMQCSYEHLRRGEPKLKAYPPDVRAIVAGFADTSTSSSSSSSTHGIDHNSSRSVVTNGPAGNTLASAGPNGHDGVCPAKSQAFPWLGPSARPFSAINLNATAASAASAAAADSASASARHAVQRAEIEEAATPPAMEGAALPSTAAAAMVSPHALKPGVWHYETLPCDHLGLVAAQRCPHAQRRFFQSLYQRLYALDQHLTAAKNTANASVSAATAASAESLLGASLAVPACAPPLPVPLSWLEPSTSLPWSPSQPFAEPPNHSPPLPPSVAPPAASGGEGRHVDCVDIFPYRSETTAKWSPYASNLSPKGVEEAPTSEHAWAHTSELILP